MASADFEPGAKLRALAATIAKPTAILNKFGAFMVGRATKAFREQKRGAAIWPVRHVPNIPGIISDMERGRTPPPRRWKDGPAGLDEGTLVKSLTWRLVGTKAVEIGSLLPYAGKINDGAETTIMVSRLVKERLGRYLDSLDGKAGRAAKVAFGSGPKSGDFDGYAKAVKRAGDARSTLGYLLNPRVTEINWTIPARPFVAIDTQDLAEFTKIVLRLAFKPGAAA